MKVYVCDPPKSGKNGANFLLVAKEGGVEWRRKSARTSDRAEAEKAAARWLADILRTVSPIEENPTVAAVFERHLAALEVDPDVQATTRVTYRTAARRLLPLLGSVRASDVDRLVVVEAAKRLRAGETPSEKALLGSSIKLTLRKARAVWAWAQERGYVARPWPTLKRKDVQAKRTKRRPYTDAEVVAVLAWIKVNRSAWHAFFSLMASTGMRSSEVCGLRGRDVLRGQLEVRFPDAKSKEPTGATVTADVMDLLPRVADDAVVFRGPKGAAATPHAANEVKLAAVRALKLPDADRLDVHSFKRSWVDSLHRAKVDVGTALRAARHSTFSSHFPYQANAVGHDVRAAQELVLERRRAAAGLDPSPKPSPNGGANPVPTNALPWFESHPDGSTQPPAVREDATPAPHQEVVPKCLPLLGGARRPGEGFDGIEDPFSGDIGEWVALKPAAAWALATTPARQQAVRRWIMENRPEVIPEACSAAERKRRAR